MRGAAVRAIESSANSSAAERDLEGIWKYTMGKWGFEQADRYTDLLTAAFGSSRNCDYPNSRPGLIDVPQKRSAFPVRSIELPVMQNDCFVPPILFIDPLKTVMTGGYRAINGCARHATSADSSCAEKPHSVHRSSRGPTGGLSSINPSRGHAARRRDQAT